MGGWLGQRKWITIILFLLPTIMAILIFNIYPILLNSYVSFTNRNKFHPNPDCSVYLTDLLDPLCWKVFGENTPTGIGQPYTLQDPVLANDTIFGKIISARSSDGLTFITDNFCSFCGAIILEKSKKER